jgi:hypothetical protein
MKNNCCKTSLGSERVGWLLFHKWVKAKGCIEGMSRYAAGNDATRWVVSSGLKQVLGCNWSMYDKFVLRASNRSELPTCVLIYLLEDICHGTISTVPTSKVISEETHKILYLLSIGYRQKTTQPLRTLSALVQSEHVRPVIDTPWALVQSQVISWHCRVSSCDTQQCSIVCNTSAESGETSQTRRWTRVSVLTSRNILVCSLA